MRGCVLFQVAEAVAESTQRQLLDLTTAQGLQETRGRAAQADYWEGKFGEALEQAARERNAHALKIQRGTHPEALASQKLAASSRLLCVRALSPPITILGACVVTPLPRFAVCHCICM